MSRRGWAEVIPYSKTRGKLHQTNKENVVMNIATIIINCDRNTIEIKSEPIDISKLRYPIKDNRAEIIAQLISNHIHTLMDMSEEDLKSTMINYLDFKKEK